MSSPFVIAPVGGLLVAGRLLSKELASLPTQMLVKQLLITTHLNRKRRPSQHKPHLIDRERDALPNKIGQVAPELAVRHGFESHAGTVPGQSVTIIQ